MKEITKINVLHRINKNSKHYADVKEYMTKNGAPIIRVCDNGNGIYALEGSHRIAAAYELGIMPIFEEVEADEIFENDIENDDIKTAGDICAYSDQIIYDFEEIYYAD